MPTVQGCTKQASGIEQQRSRHTKGYDLSAAISSLSSCTMRAICRTMRCSSSPDSRADRLMASLACCTRPQRGRQSMRKQWARS